MVPVVPKAAPDPRRAKREKEKLEAEILELEKRLEEAQLNAQSNASNDKNHLHNIGGISVITQRVDPADPSVFRQLADRHRDQLNSGIIGLAGETGDGKALILVAATKDLVSRGFKAGDAVRVMANEVGGKGGGKPDMAQAGGTDPSRIPNAFEKLLEIVQDLSSRLSQTS